MTALSLFLPRPLRSPVLPILHWIALSKGRKRLAELDPHLLADIGVTSGMARTEASRPFWDAPTHWRG